jgi:hypothetical protein
MNGTEYSAARGSTIATMLQAGRALALAFKPRPAEEDSAEIAPVALSALLVFLGYFLGAKVGFTLTFQPHPVNAMLLNEFLKEHRKVETQEATITGVKSIVARQAATITNLKSALAQMQKEVETLTASLKAQAAQVHKVSDQLKTQAAVSRVVAND